MSDLYRVFGSENSPYSVKTRSYFRYKKIPHEWIVRNQETTAEYKKYARLPIVPAVATPEDQGLQDSTPIIEAMESQFTEPSIHPSDPTLQFLSELIEEFADEWGEQVDVPFSLGARSRPTICRRATGCRHAGRSIRRAASHDG